MFFSLRYANFGDFIFFEYKFDYIFFVQQTWIFCNMMSPLRYSYFIQGVEPLCLQGLLRKLHVFFSFSTRFSLVRERLNYEPNNEDN